MTRRPRKPEEHLVSGKLLGHAYGNMGELATCGGFFTYNLIMTCYGFPFWIYFELLSNPTYNPDFFNGNLNYNTLITYNSVPGASVVNVTNGFNTNSSTLGSNNYYTGIYQNNCSAAVADGALQTGNNYPNWLSTVNNVVDLRYAYVTCCPNGLSYCTPFTWPNPAVPNQ